VQPYHLACIDQQWYLFAHDLVRSQLRTFVLSRMRTVQNTRMRFRRPADFSITKHLSDSLGVFSTNGRFKVRLEFDDFAARLVSERNWHPSQKIKQLADGRIELNLELGSMEEIERWILSWGARVRVLAPAELKKRILVAVTAILSSG
jgi:proteasome accessory factor B